MTKVEEFGDDEPPAPWHNSTSAVLGASAIGVAVIAALVGAVILVTGGDEPADAPLNFVEPSFSGTASPTPSAPTTTPTITSTTPVSTTEINPPLVPPTPSDSSATSSSSESAPPPRQREDDGRPTTRTPRRPRTNVTRTLLPRPLG